jgi:hypothetical protein
VNLRIAADNLTAIAKREAGVPGASAISVTLAVITTADAMLKEDIAANKVQNGCGHSCMQEGLVKAVSQTDWLRQDMHAGRVRHACPVKVCMFTGQGIVHCSQA